MASAKELKAWEQRESVLRASLSIANRSVDRATEALKSAQAVRALAEQRLETHLATAPVLTKKQAEKRRG